MTPMTTIGHYRRSVDVALTGRNAVTRRVTAHAVDKDERLSPYPLTFEEAQRVALRIDHRQVDVEEGTPMTTPPEPGSDAFVDYVMEAAYSDHHFAEVMKEVVARQPSVECGVRDTDAELEKLSRAYTL